VISAKQQLRNVRNYYDVKASSGIAKIAMIAKNAKIERQMPRRWTRGIREKKQIALHSQVSSEKLRASK
jgi:hypothetical protein